MFGDLGKIMKIAGEMKSKLPEMQEKLAAAEYTAEAGGGMVKVKANGKRKILGIELDEDVIDPDDAEMLEDLIVAGVNKALDKAEEASQEHMQKIYKDMMPGGGIPGMDMSKLGL